MTTVSERVSILETKFDNFEEKMDDIKLDITVNHSSIISTLTEMRDASTSQHSDMAAKIKDLEEVKNKWMKYGMIAMAFAAGAGWIGNPSMTGILKFVGL